MNAEKIPNSDRISELWAKIKNALTGKQNTLTPDESITLNNGNISVTTPVKEITQAEYDKLSDAEKNTGLYVVTDANINLNDRGEIYSTEEICIGTWVDGRPIYSKTIVANTSSLSYEAQIAQTIWTIPNTINEIIDISGTLHLSDLSSYAFPFIVRWDGRYNSLTCKAHLNIKQLQLVSSADSPNLFLNGNCKVTVKYTKTTDSATISQAAVMTSKVELPETLSSVSYAPASASFAKLNL